MSFGWRKRRTKADLLSGVTKPYEFAKLAKSGRSTVLIDYADKSWAVRYHDTDVVTFLENGNVILNSGGFRSNTTKDRFNQYAKVVKVWQEKGIWYCYTDKEKDLLFYDGIEFDSEGNLLSERKVCDHKRINRIKRKIAKYVKAIREMDGKLPIPDSGDCWSCAFTSNNGKSMGDLSNDHSHLEMHLDETYIHGSILVNAMRERGYNDNQIRTQFSLNCRDYFARAVRRYLMRRLLPEVCTN